ncbi:MAG: hypothetical protein DRJ50_02715 [Actinobacteria bacterium]|nr:MAG: hypothetical protein DRJ50_02715 [Actinomycetota bacterium]
MTSVDPRIGFPRLGTPTEVALQLANTSIIEQRPLPELIEPSELEVADPVDDPLVRVEGYHPRIQVAAHYQLGGWSNAIGECWLRSGVASRLGAVADGLPDPFGLLVYDGWRPRALQAELYLAALSDPAIPPGFLAEPSRDEIRPAPHESGGAVDLALTVEGVAIAPGTDFDDTTSTSFAAALENKPGPDREARRMLYWAMRSTGFIVYEGEWWHFEFGTRRWAGIVGRSPIFGPAQPPS